MRNLAVIAVVAVMSCFAPAQAAPSWTVKFIAGPSWPGADSLQLKVQSTEIELVPIGSKTNWARPVKIPMSTVRDIVYSPTRFSRGQAMGPQGIVGGPAQAAAVYNSVYLLVAAFASGMHGQKHFFTIEWEDRGVEQELMFEAPKEVAPQLMQQMEQAAGPKWMNLEKRCRRATDDLAHQADKAFTVTLEQPASVAQFHLPAGQYRAVLLERTGSPSELYLFAGGDIERTALKAIALVDVTAAASPGDPRVQLSPTKQLAQVRMGDKLLTVR